MTRRWVYRVQPSDDTTINWETRDRHLFCRRHTGHLGTGLYVYLERPDGVSEREGLQRFKYPWKHPLIIETEKQLEAFTEFSRYICSVSSASSVQLKEEDFVRNIPSPSMREGLPDEIFVFSLAAAAVAWVRRPNKVIQPINYILHRCGYDGIVNQARDDQVHGSVIYKPPSPMPHPPYDYDEQLRLPRQKLVSWKTKAKS